MQDPYKITRFGLIRHAETVWNRGKRIQGHSDSPLTAAGERQASSWGQILARFSWDRILASDTGRALTTGERINEFLKLPIETDPRLREQDWGRWEGKTVPQIQAEAAQVLNAGEWRELAVQAPDLHRELRPAKGFVGLTDGLAKFFLKVSGGSLAQLVTADLARSLLQLLAQQRRGLVGLIEGQARFHERTGENSP